MARSQAPGDPCPAFGSIVGPGFAFDASSWSLMQLQATPVQLHDIEDMPLASIARPAG